MARLDAFHQKAVAEVNLAAGQNYKVTQSNGANAAQELNAEAEMMKRTVTELLRLVDGGKQCESAQSQTSPRVVVPEHRKPLAFSKDMVHDA
jgi:hypothetical protein